MRTVRDRSDFRKVHIRPESRECPACGEVRAFAWNARRHVSFVGSSLDIDYHVYKCMAPGCPLQGILHRPEWLTSRVLKKREFGLDVEPVRLLFRLRHLGTSVSVLRTPHAFAA